MSTNSTCPKKNTEHDNKNGTTQPVVHTDIGKINDSKTSDVNNNLDGTNDLQTSEVNKDLDKTDDLQPSRVNSNPDKTDNLDPSVVNSDLDKIDDPQTSRANNDLDKPSDSEPSIINNENNMKSSKEDLQPVAKNTNQDKKKNNEPFIGILLGTAYYSMALIVIPLFVILLVNYLFKNEVEYTALGKGITCAVFYTIAYILFFIAAIKFFKNNVNFKKIINVSIRVKDIITPFVGFILTPFCSSLDRNDQINLSVGLFVAIVVYATVEEGKKSENKSQEKEELNSKNDKCNSDSSKD